RSLMNAQSLVGDEEEEPVLDDRSAERGAEIMRSQERLGCAEKRRRIEGVVADKFPSAAVQLITAGLGYRGKYGGASPILGGDARSDDTHLLNCVGGWQFNCLATKCKIHTFAIALLIGRERTIPLHVQTLLDAVDVLARTD